MRFTRKFYVIGSLLLIILLLTVSLTVVITHRLLEGGQQAAKGKISVVPPTVVIPQQAQTGGKVYYVSPTGNDQNDGSQASPFATIQHAARVVTPGTTVHVLPGTYTQPVIVDNDGSADARIVFISDSTWSHNGKRRSLDHPC